MSKEVKKTFLKDEQLIIFLTALEVVIAAAWGLIVTFFSVPLGIILFVALTATALAVNNHLLESRPFKSFQKSIYSKKAFLKTVFSDN